VRPLIDVCYPASRLCYHGGLWGNVVFLAVGRERMHIREYIVDILRMREEGWRASLMKLNRFGWDSMRKFREVLVIGVQCCATERRERITLLAARDKLAELLP
jgi:hypothetical protein